MIGDTLAIERTFVGCLLRSPDDFADVSDLVTPDMLSTPVHQRILDAISFLWQAERRVSNEALQSCLPAEDSEGVPYIAHVMALRQSAQDAGATQDYASALAAAAAEKRLDGLADWIRSERRKAERSPEDIAAELSLRAQEIMATASPIKPTPLSVITERVVTFSLRSKKNDTMPGFTTGLAGLDEMTGLVMGGDFWGVIGALGEGKSALLAQLGKHIAKQVPVLACHNEMGEEQNATRAVAGESGMSVREVREGAYDFDGEEAVRAAHERLKSLKYHLYTDTKMTVRKIRAQALAMKRKEGLGAITIDGFKRLKTEAKHRDKWDRYEELTGSIKELALDLAVPVILAVQRTRTARRRDDPVPQLDDADAPTLETDADVVLGVWREEAWLMMNKPNAKAGGEAWDEWEAKVRKCKGIGKMILLKARSGAAFETREFKWDGRATTFRDL